MFGQKRTDQRSINDAEWDFSGIDPADAEVCLRYELAREVKSPQSYFSAFPHSNAAPFPFHPLPISASMMNGASEAFRRAAQNTCLRNTNLFALDEGDGLIELLSGMYFLHPDDSIRAYPVGLQSTPWQKLDPDWQLRLSLYATQDDTGFLVHDPKQVEDLGAEVQDLVKYLTSSSRHRLFVASVDWRRNNAELIEGFTKWLDETRPAEFPVKIAIGRQSAVDRLNALTALRLRHMMTADEAAKYTKRMRGKPMYSERPAWERAQKRAVALFCSVYPGAGEPISATKFGVMLNPGAL